jgi:hypothetical protein
MAKFENMTLSYTQIASVPFRTRRSASGSLLDALSRDLTPGQRVALFPSYVNQIYASGGVKDAKTVPSSGGGPPPRVDATVETVGPPKPYGLGSYPNADGKYTGAPKTPAGWDSRKKYKENGSDQQKSLLAFANRWGIAPEAVAGVLSVESKIDPASRGGAGNNFYGVFQLQNTQIPALTDKAGFGRLTPDQYLNLSLDDQLKVMDEYYKGWKVKPKEFFTGDAKTDTAKMWALQLAPGNADSIDYNNPNVMISNTEQAEIISSSRGGVTVGSALGSLERGNEFFVDAPLELVDTKATTEPINDPQIAEATAEPINVGQSTTIDGVNATVLTYGNEDANNLGGVPVLKVKGMEGVYAGNSATKSAKPYEGVILHVTGKQSISEQLEFQKNGGEGSPGGYGYQYIIDKDGNIVEAADPVTDRPNQVHIKGRHGRTDLQNSNSLGIGFITGGGNPTEAQLESLRKFLPQVYKKFGIPTTLPDGTPNYPVGHGETQYNRGSAFGLGPNQTPEGSVMADVVRNNDYWNKLQSYDPTYNTTEEPVANASAQTTEVANASASQLVNPVPRPVEPETQPMANASASQLVNPVPRPVEPETETATPEPKKQTLQDITGLPTKGYSAAAGGAEITDPSMIISEDGKKVTRVAETGPEKLSVMPRHKSSDVFQEQHAMMQEARQEKAQEAVAKPDIATLKSSQRMSDFGRSRETGQSIAISTSMPKITPSANKAFADAKMVGRFNKADIDGDMGIVYIDRGYA